MYFVDLVSCLEEHVKSLPVFFELDVDKVRTFNNTKTKLSNFHQLFFYNIAPNEKQSSLNDLNELFHQLVPERLDTNIYDDCFVDGYDFSKDDESFLKLAFWYFDVCKTNVVFFSNPNLRYVQRIIFKVFPDVSSLRTYERFSVLRIPYDF